MNSIIKNSLCIAFLASCSMATAVAPYYSIRSQSENIARELVGAGWNTQINLCDMDKWYGNFSITPEWTSSFKPCKIAQCLFGCFDNCNNCGTSSCATTSHPCSDPCCDEGYRIHISGSQVLNRAANDWLADNFGLPTDYKSCVTFKPKIDNFLVDFNFYLGLDEWCQGMYFRIHAPVVHTRWDLNMCECVEDKGIANHEPGYFNGSFSVNGTTTLGIARENLVSTFSSYISGCGIINSRDINFNPLCFAKMDCCRRDETALADIRMALGWNFLCDECYHVGLGIYAAAPTGNRPEGAYLFEPIVGNGKHWELGGQFTSHWTFWADDCEESLCSFYLDANVSHLFKTKQCRVFDLKCKPLSRYMLAAKFKTTVDTLIAGEVSATATQPSKQFEGTYIPVANLTHIPVDVSVGVQADLAFMLQYTHCNWSCDLGYNFWGRSCEKIECRCDCCACFEQNIWALKGDSFMYGFLQGETAPNFVTPGAALSATQSCATIYSGKNTPAATSTAPWQTNPGVDNSSPAWATTQLALYNPTTGEHINTSIDPVFIANCDFDLCGAQTKGLSHKLFLNVDYSWSDRECWIPYLGIGGEVEFGQKQHDDCDTNNCNNSCYNSCDSVCNQHTTCFNPCNTNCCNNCCNDSCCNCALSQWGIWLKGGVAFN